MFSSWAEHLRENSLIVPLVFDTARSFRVYPQGCMSCLCIWDRKNNLEPWNKMAPTDQYKLFTVNMDYSKLKRDRPVFLNFLSPTLHLV
uniref:Cytochrome c oxidase subunit NDUFA4 n=1 Tax=Oncorhynchus tshawytscha TaxID=74940 RepID=A0AAZ3R869_ONCTS